MRAYDIIEKKKNKKELSHDEIDFLVNGFVKEEIPDYQMSAFLMAVCLNGMTDRETAALTMIIANSSDVIDLSEIKGIKVDKHSTGGVGDKTTLIVAPIVASLGVKVAKMSGRGLGHTGGTIDKLESIPNFNVVLDKENFIKNVNEVGLSIIAQSGDIAVADKKIYALRDVTATVDSIALIASSIMGKKIASGSDCILLDVKCGSGAFMKNIDEAVKLAKLMVSIGNIAGKKTTALITNMDIPLGYNIGNSLEIIESINVLRNKGPLDLTEVSKALSANMLYLSQMGSIKECEKMVDDAINTGKALETFKKFIHAQGGNPNIVEDFSLLPNARYEFEVKSDFEGYISEINTKDCGIASVILGAGREYKEQKIDYGAGIILKKKTTDFVNKGDTLAILYANKKEVLNLAADKIKNSYKITKDKVDKEKEIIAKVTIDNVEYY